MAPYLVYDLAKHLVETRVADSAGHLDVDLVVRKVDQLVSYWVDHSADRLAVDLVGQRVYCSGVD